MTEQQTIYKILRESEWQAAQTAGVYRGSALDLRDGFIHFSTGAQVAETAGRHFAGQRDLLLLCVDTATLGDALKWEPSRGGALFPHLYGSLALEHVQRTERLPLAADGVHQLPGL